MIKIKNDEIRDLLIGGSKKFPKYVSPVINLVNGYSGGTRPKVVGQMSELIQECPAKNYKEWREWYLLKNPEAVSAATEKIMSKLEEVKAAANSIDRKMVEEWVMDLVIEKTFLGLRFQEAILKAIAQKSGQEYRLSSPSDEATGIDGYIGEEAVSIKPLTYKTKNTQEKIDAKMIYYEKKKDGIVIYD